MREGALMAAGFLGGLEGIGGGGLSDGTAGEDVLSVSHEGEEGSVPLWLNNEGGGWGLQFSGLNGRRVNGEK